MGHDRKIRQKPIRISYEEFRTTANAKACCSGSSLDTTTTLVTLAVRKLEGTKPAEMMEQLLGGQEGAPVHGVWHHALAGEILLLCLKNAGYQIGDELIDEIVERGRLIPGGACGFLGVCGALVSTSAAYSILFGSTPVATEAREKLLGFYRALAARLAEFGGSRCCKKSTYIALELAQEEFPKIGFELPKEEFAGRCLFFADNETCDGVECEYFPRKS